MWEKALRAEFGSEIIKQLATLLVPIRLSRRSESDCLRRLSSMDRHFRCADPDQRAARATWWRPSGVLLRRWRAESGPESERQDEHAQGDVQEDEGVLKPAEVRH